MTHTYFNINDRTFDKYTYKTEDNGDVKPITLHSRFLDNEDKDGFDFTYKIDNENDLGPLAPDKIRSYITTLEAFYLIYTLKHNFNSDLPVIGTCYEWEIT